MHPEDCECPICADSILDRIDGNSADDTLRHEIAAHAKRIWQPGADVPDEIQSLLELVERRLKPFNPMTKPGDL